jgi:hypothetical protein
MVRTQRRLADAKVLNDSRQEQEQFAGAGLWSLLLLSPAPAPVA